MPKLNYEEVSYFQSQTEVSFKFHSSNSSYICNVLINTELIETLKFFSHAKLPNSEAIYGTGANMLETLATRLSTCAREHSCLTKQNE